MISLQKNIPLAPFTSFKVGGHAEFFVEAQGTDELLDVLEHYNITPYWLLGYGSNTLISDQGLPGITICMKGGKIAVQNDTIVADAGVWWDDVVQKSIAKNLWGIELMSEIPGSVGAALFINITAYGQSIGPRVNWIEVWDTKTHQVKKLLKNELSWGYKQSIFQKPENNHFIILRAELQLDTACKEKLIYQKALDVAEELKLSVDSLENRRNIIIETRKRAGSLWHPDDKKPVRSAGSFFRNPVVTKSQAETIISSDETGITKEQIMKMNKVHGGDSLRVSAAHVMLAAGFHRGQKWDHIYLNEKNLLKIETEDGATAQDVYDVMTIIQQTCFEKTGVKLEPEVRLLGTFNT